MRIALTALLIVAASMYAASYGTIPVPPLPSTTDNQPVLVPVPPPSATDNQPVTVPVPPPSATDNQPVTGPVPPPATITGDLDRNVLVPSSDRPRNDPPPPTPYLPSNGDTGVCQTPVLIVEPYPGLVVWYNFCIRAEGNKVAEKFTVLPFWFIYEGASILSPGGSYQWSCRVYVRGAWSDWFDPQWSFRVAWPTAAPTPVSPANNSQVSTVSPLLCVIGSMIGQHYTFRITEDGGPLVIEKEVRMPFWRVPEGAGFLESGKSYLWTCRVDNGGGWSNWFGPSWRFTIVDPSDGQARPGNAQGNSLPRAVAPDCRIHPEPFADQTTISYALPRTADVSIAFYTIQGRKVKELTLRNQAAGSHQLTWNGTDRQNRPLPSGVYLLCLKSGDDEKTVRITKSE
jgi:hypothetical protein